MAVTSKRAEHLAWFALPVSVLFFLVTVLLARWSGFFAVYAVSWLILAAVLVWLVLLIQFHQRALAEQEKLDMAQLAKAKEGPTIFQGEAGAEAMFAVAQKRLFAAIIALYELGIGSYLLWLLLNAEPVELRSALLCAVLLTGIAFVSFLISRFATGMATQFEWKPLRAGGSMLFAVAILCLAIAIALTFAQFKVFVVINVLGWVVTALLVLLGLETALNLILDIYRPRLKGQYQRTAFDSRMLGVINEPGGVFHSLAAAIDYQFGFKVSQTWFYQLLVKAFVPLVLFAAAVLYLMSCIVVLNPNEQAVVEHFGNPRDSAGNVRVIGPGLHVKWPWPVDKVYKYPTERISQLTIGYVPEEYEKGQKRPALLWGQKHYKEEYELLVAGEKGTEQLEQTGAVPVSIVMAAVPIQYKVKDIYSFLYNCAQTTEERGIRRRTIYQAEQLLKALCYRELTRFAANARIEVDTLADLEESLFGAGRERAKRILTDRIQQAADKAGLGVEIVFVGLQGIHPPVDLAQDYQAVVSAVQKKQAEILKADAQRNKTLSSLAGSVTAAERLSALAAQYQRARDDNDSDAVGELSVALDKAFAEAKGEIFTKLRSAQSYAFGKAIRAKGLGERFAGQIKAYRAARDFYIREQRLRALEEGLKNARKYLVIADTNDTQVTVIDLQEKLTPSLWDVTGIEEPKK